MSRTGSNSMNIKMGAANNSGIRSSELRRGARQLSGQGREQASFGALRASELFCPKCDRAMPVRERMLLVLSGGDVYDYTCAGCGSTLGTRRT